MEANVPSGGAILNTRGIISGIYKGNYMATRHCYTQNIKVLGYVVSEKKYFFSIVGIWELMTPKVGPFFLSQGHDWHHL